MKRLFVDACLAILFAVALAFALAASMNLDRDFTPPATQDALRDAQCEADRPPCTAEVPSDPSEQQINDPRVQRTLRAFCSEGQSWACPLVRKEKML